MSLQDPYVRARVDGLRKGFLAGGTKTHAENMGTTTTFGGAAAALAASSRQPVIVSSLNQVYHTRTREKNACHYPCVSSSRQPNVRK